MRFERDVSLRGRHSLGLQARAEHFATATTVEEAREALAYARSRRLRVVALGDGTNCLPARKVSGLVLEVAIGRAAWELCASEGQVALVRCGAGANWHRFVGECLRRGWHGLENLALIPGRVGAAPVQNIGAYGVELSDFVDSVEALLVASGERVNLSPSDCAFGYRDSVFRGEGALEAVICGLQLRLSRDLSPCTDHEALNRALGESEASPQAVFDAVVKLRRSRLPDPLHEPNAGSFFINPLVCAARYRELREQFPRLVAWPSGAGRVKLSAAALLEAAGWRGRRLGAFKMSERHALVLVHCGADGDAEQLRDFAERVRADIRGKFGVSLEIEPCWL